MRQCGECQLCCTLLPVRELGKTANTRCVHQRWRKGCAVYTKPAMPIACKVWTCIWLAGDTDLHRRPDRAGYVVDVAPDFVRLTLSGQPERRVVVVQVWVDPDRPDAWQSPELFAYLARVNKAALIRCGSNGPGMLIMPPDHPQHPAPGKWGIARSHFGGEAEHSAAEIAEVLQQQEALNG